MVEYIMEFGEALYDEETGEAVFKPEIKGKLTRCKDCIRRNSDRCPFNREYHAEGINIALDYTKDDGFCHWGEEETE